MGFADDLLLGEEVDALFSGSEDEAAPPVKAPEVAPTASSAPVATTAPEASSATGLDEDMLVDEDERLFDEGFRDEEQQAGAHTAAESSDGAAGSGIAGDVAFAAAPVTQLGAASVTPTAPEATEATTTAASAVLAAAAAEATARFAGATATAAEATATATATASAAGKADPALNVAFDETRYLKDADGELIMKWKVDYASRAGGGRAMCKDNDCLERYEQGGDKLIEKGCLRIGRRVLMKGRGSDDDDVVTTMWFHARCIFNTFLRARKDTRVIQSPADIEGFDSIDPEDQEMLRIFIANNDQVRSWRGRGGGVGGKAAAAAAASGAGASGAKEPRGAKRPGDASVDMSPMKVAKPPSPNDVKFKPGYRVWTYCRVKPPPPPPGSPAVPAAAFGVKSPRSELGMIVDEEKDGCFVIQFESAEHEKERLEKFQSPKAVKIRGWLRFPRVFEGKKQKIPVNWIDKNRKPPRLCTCVRQEWGHSCDLTGISCGRGVSRKVWGVGQ